MSNSTLTNLFPAASRRSRVLVAVTFWTTPKITFTPFSSSRCARSR